MSFLEDIFVNLTDYDFENSQKIGDGSYGICYIVNDKKDPNKQFCAKITRAIITSAKHQENLLREVVVLKNVKHKAILNFKGFNLYDFDHTSHPTIITDYMPNGPLDAMLKKELQGKAPSNWNITKKQICIIGVAAAMRHLHRQKVMHRDLKPANVLLDANFYPKVCDFGFARGTVELDSFTKGIGTPLFMAPEILHGDSDYRFQVDVYSFALLAYQIATNKLPYEDFFKANPKAGHIEFVRWVYTHQNRPSFENTNVNPEFAEFIKKCWAPLPNDRPTFDQIYDRLIDDMNLVINDEVNIDEVQAYINELKDSITTGGKKKLQAAGLSSYEKNDEAPNSKIPTNQEDRIKMFNEVIDKNDFNMYPPEVFISLSLSLFGYMQENLQKLIKVTIFANSLASNNDLSALKFLNEIFGKEVTPAEITTFTKNDVKNISGACLNISRAVKSIDEGAFIGSQLNRINIPPSIKKIGKSAFKDCNKLSWINLNGMNDNLTEIEESAFENCTKLEYVELPSSLKIIRKNAFKKCTSLKEITIPHSVTQIELNAFQYCKSLMIVHIGPQTQYDQKHTFPLRTSIAH